MIDAFPEIAELLAAETDMGPPPGWYPLTYAGGFHKMLGPVYGGRRNGRILIGFRCLPRHLNPINICHGGVTASFCDYQGIASQGHPRYETRIGPTVSLAVEYLAPIRCGEWVEGQGEFVGLSGNMAFCRFIGRVGAQPVIQSRGIFMNRPIPDEVGLELLRNIEAGGIDAETNE